MIDVKSESFALSPGFDRRAVMDGSRGLQPTVLHSKSILSQRDNGTSAKQVTVIHRQIMHGDKLPVFFIESRPGMVLPLAGDVTNRISDLRLPHGERTVSILPGKRFHRRALFGNPLGRFPFEASHPFAESNRRGQAYQQMDMVVHAADLQCIHPMRPANTPQITPNTLLNVGCDPALAVLGREHDMQANGRVSVGHLAENLIRCRAATQSSVLRIRGLKPTATVLDRAAVGIRTSLCFRNF